MEVNLKIKKTTIVTAAAFCELVLKFLLCNYLVMVQVLKGFASA